MSQKEGSKLGAKEDFAKMVGLDLFNFMQSFGGVAQVSGGGWSVDSVLSVQLQGMVGGWAGEWL